MKSDKYQDTIDMLKGVRPLPDNPRALAGLVMEKVKGQEARYQRTYHMYARYVRPILTAAAVFLLSLFVYENAGTGKPGTAMHMTGIMMDEEIGHKVKVGKAKPDPIPMKGNNCHFFFLKTSTRFQVQQAFDCYLQYQNQKQPTGHSLQNKVQAVVLKY